MLARRLWLAALVLYAGAALADFGLHLARDSRAGRDWHDATHLAVAFSASLFWPVDLVAEYLRPR